MIAMGRKKTVEGDTSHSTTHTFYEAPDRWKLFQEIADSLGFTASELLRQKISEVLQQYSQGELKQKFDLDSKKAERLRLKKNAWNLQKLLDRTLPNHRSVYETLCAFSGTDRALKNGLDKALGKMEVYICDGSEPFTDTHVEDFVGYLETVKKIRTIEAEIKAYRRSKNGGGSDHLEGEQSKRTK